MTDRIRKFEDSIGNRTVLSWRENGTWRERKDHIREACGRFMQSASLLGKKGFLGWQITSGADAKPMLTAFTADGAEATRGDLQWMFGKSAETMEAQEERIPSLFGESRRVYVLRRAEESPSEVSQGFLSGRKKYGMDLVEAVGKEQVMIRMLAGQVQNGGQGTVLISVPGEMSLRMRTILSLAIPKTMAAEVTEEWDPEGAENLLDTECLEEGMAWMFVALMTLLTGSGNHGRDFPDDPDAFEDPDYWEMVCLEAEDGEGEDSGRMRRVPDSASIDELDLSLRAANCLRRAGVTTVGEVREAAEHGFSGIRNIGEKTVKELREKLALTLRAEEEHAGMNPAAMLDELVGLEEVKEQVRKIAAFARMKQDMQARGRKTLPVVLNMEFRGNPGTAKTTVARILAGLFCEIGLLSDPEPVEVGRGGLVAKFVGQTADKVREVFCQARGKLLLIDEAYALSEGGEGDFGNEAITTIVQEMENHREETIVVFAGYPDRMDAFFEMNPGLRSRVPFTIRFADYSEEEMVRIVRLEAQKRGFSLQQEAERQAAAACRVETESGRSGNGRFCRNLVEQAILEYAERNYGSERPSDAEEFVLTAEDFRKPDAFRESGRRKIGFGA